MYWLPEQSLGYKKKWVTIFTILLVFVSLYVLTPRTVFRTQNGLLFLQFCLFLLVCMCWLPEQSLGHKMGYYFYNFSLFLLVCMCWLPEQSLGHKMGYYFYNFSLFLLVCMCWLPEQSLGHKMGYYFHNFSKHRPVSLITHTNRNLKTLYTPSPLSQFPLHLIYVTLYPLTQRVPYLCLLDVSAPGSATCISFPIVGLHGDKASSWPRSLLIRRHLQAAAAGESPIIAMVTICSGRQRGSHRGDVPEVRLALEGKQKGELVGIQDRVWMHARLIKASVPPEQVGIKEKD